MKKSKEIDWSKRQQVRSHAGDIAQNRRHWRELTDSGVFDIHPTVPAWTEVLLRHEQFTGGVWECACGTGAMSRVLEAGGYDVVSTNIPDQGYGRQLDFLLATELLAPNIVTNPPYRHLNEFIATALQLLRKGGGQKLALLIGQSALGGKRRSLEIWNNPKSKPHKAILVGNYMPNSYNGMIYAFYHVWVVWDVSRKCRKTELVWDLAR